MFWSVQFEMAIDFYRILVSEFRKSTRNDSSCPSRRLYPVIYPMVITTQDLD